MEENEQFESKPQKVAILHPHAHQLSKQLVARLLFSKKKKNFLGGDHDKFVRTLPNIDLHQTLLAFSVL